MTDRGHMDPNLVRPPCLERPRDQGCWPELFLEPPMGRRVPTALPAHDRHFFPIAPIAAERRNVLARTRFEAAPGKRQILALQGAGAPMVGKEVRQSLMRGVR